MTTPRRLLPSSARGLLCALALLPMRALALPPPCPRAPTAAERQQARALWDEAQRLLQEQGAAAVLPRVERSYQLSCSPKLLVNLAQLYDQLGRRDEAIAALERFVAAPGPSDPAILQRARTFLDELRQVSVTLEWSPPEAAVLIDGNPIGGAGRATLRLPLGRHALAASAPPGYAALQQTLDVAPGMSPVKIALVSTRVPVTLAWTPAQAEVSVDGVPITGTNGQAQVPLLPGTHALLVRAAGYADHSQLLTVAPGAASTPIRVALAPQAALRLRTPRGYRVLLDDRPLPGGAPVPATYLQESSTAAEPGRHQLQAIGPHGRRLARTFDTALGAPIQDIVIRPPTLIGGLVLGAASLLAIGVGGGLFGASRTNCPASGCEPTTLSQTGTAFLSLGGAVFVPALVWFAVNAADHPRFAR